MYLAPRYSEDFFSAIRQPVPLLRERPKRGIDPTLGGLHDDEIRVDHADAFEIGTQQIPHDRNIDEFLGRPGRASDDRALETEVDEDP